MAERVRVDYFSQIKQKNLCLALYGGALSTIALQQIGSMSWSKPIIVEFAFPPGEWLAFLQVLCFTLSKSIYASMVVSPLQICDATYGGNW